MLRTEAMKIRDIISYVDRCEMEEDNSLMLESQVVHDDDEDLFVGFFKYQMTSCQSSETGLDVEIDRLLLRNRSTCDPVAYWIDNNSMRNLRRLTLSVLSIPASSAPIERVFSVGGEFFFSKAQEHGEQAANAAYGCQVQQNCVIVVVHQIYIGCNMIYFRSHKNAVSCATILWFHLSNILEQI